MSYASLPHHSTRFYGTQAGRRTIFKAECDGTHVEVGLDVHSAIIVPANRGIRDLAQRICSINVSLLP